MLADVRNNKVELGKINDDELPTELKAKPSAERQVWLDGRLKQRAELEEKMVALITKRDEFVLAESKKSAKPKTADSFDSAVEDTLRSQLK